MILLICCTTMMDAMGKSRMTCMGEKKRGEREQIRVRGIQVNLTIAVDLEVPTLINEARLYLVIYICRFVRRCLEDVA